MTTRPTPALGAPIAVEPRRVADGVPARGHRVIVYNGEGFVRDLRATSNAFENEGRLWIRVCSEAGWYRWSDTGVMPETRDYLADCVWIE